MRQLALALALAVATRPSAKTAKVVPPPIPPPLSIHGGPVYTSGGQAGIYPKYPNLQVQIEVPPGTKPDLLMPEAFSIKADNGSSADAIKVQTLASTKYGTAVSVSLDVSGSMKGKPLDAVRTGLIKFADDAGASDKIAIQTIADDGRWDINWDDSRDRIHDALKGLATRGRLTRLWDSLLDAIHHFPATPLSQRLIVISDGHDEGSVHSEQDVIDEARAHGILIDAVGITQSNPVYLRGLQRLTAQTGGQFGQATNTAMLQQLVGSGIERLNSIPVASFHLNGLPPDGKSHRLEVAWKHDGAESTGEVTFTLPPAVSRSRTYWYWYGGGLALALLLISVLVFGRRRRVAQTSAPLVQAQAYQPAVAAPVMIPAVRAPTEALAKPAGILPRQEPRPIPAPVAVSQPEAPVRLKTTIGVRFPTPSKGYPAAWLVCEEGFAPQTRFPVDEPEYWIGALENNHLQITGDPTVSGNHACLVFDHDVLGVYDHRSTNGTRVNGELLGEKRALLRIGDRIRVGRSTFVLHAADSQRTIL
jgi:hypothetical protein